MDEERIFTAVIISRAQTELFVRTEAEHLSARASRETFQRLCAVWRGTRCPEHNAFSKRDDCARALTARKRRILQTEAFLPRLKADFYWQELVSASANTAL